MRKLLQLIVFALLMGNGMVFAQYITAGDDAGNYSQSDFVAQGSLGFGFGAWYTANSNGGYFRAAAGEQGVNSAMIDIGGNSFGLWANEFSDVGRLLTSPIPEGGTLVFTMAYKWDSGNRGFSLCHGDWGTEVFNFNINNSGYTWTGGGSAASTPWTGYREYGVSFLFSFTKNGNDFDYMFLSLAGEGPTGTGTITEANFDRVKFYVSFSPSGGDPGGNLYFNYLKTEFANPEYVPSAADVKINGNVNLASDQSLTVKNLTIISGNSFTLKSLPTGTASLITTGTITGNVTVERYLTGGWDWHLLSSPVVDQTIVGSTNFIEFPSGIGDPNVDFYRYDETATSTPWVNIKGAGGTLNTNFGTPSSNPLFVEGQGYLVSYQTAEITKSFVGVPFTGPMLIPLTYTSGGSKGWNLVGNLYPSAIDWDEGNITKSGLFSDYYYIYNQEMNGGGGGFEYYSTGFAPYSAGANGDIPAMQAFFVKAGSGSGSLILSNNCRKHSTQPFLKEQLENENLLELTLQGETYYSKSQIFLNENATPGTDNQDAFMLFSMNDEVPQVFCVSGDDKLVLNSVPAPNDELSLPLGIKVGNTGPFTMYAENIVGFSSEYAVTLEDLQENLTIDLRQNESYTFTTTNGGIHNDRFVLHLKTGVGIDESATAVQPLAVVRNHELTVYNLSDGLYKLQLTDVTGRLLFTGNYQSGRSLLLPASLTTGVCLVQLTSHRNVYVQKVVIQ